MNSQEPDLGELRRKAELGDPEAMRELALRFHQGDGVEQNLETAHYWLRRAAEAGDTWSQTTYAIELARAKDPEKDREGIEWLRRAADQGDDRARFNLGLRQILGTGTPADLEGGFVSMLQASLGGFPEAANAIKKLGPAVPEEMWPSIFERVRWPNLLFVLGPLAEGHLDQVRLSQENDDGSNEALWLKYDREFADTFFAGSAGSQSPILEPAFGAKVLVKRIGVDRARWKGKIASAITISLKDTELLPERRPVYWKPNADGLNQVTGMLGLLGARAWVEWNYLSY